MGLVTVIDGGQRQMREYIIVEEMEAVLMMFMDGSMKRICLRRRCNTNTLVVFNFLQLPQLPIGVLNVLPTKLHILIGVATLPHYLLYQI